MNKNYENSIKTLTSQAKFHISLGLDRVTHLLDLFGNPQDDLRIVHVAGTNGKGSTCAMLASILSHAGYKTGLFTSPHLVDYTERLKINGQDISKQDFADIFFRVIEKAENADIPVTEFEILTVMAFLYFKEQNTDIVVLETGLGGRLDATNIIKNPVLSIITTIDLDHIDRLGNTIEKIAFEKAGIIKPNRPVITLKNNAGIKILEEVSMKKQAPLVLADDSIYNLSKNGEISDGKHSYFLPLLGLWQKKNLALVLKAVEVLHNCFDISDLAVESGLKNVNWPGRMQYIKDKNIIIDGAHNLSGAKALKESLEFYFPDKKRIWIYSSISTKDYTSIMSELFAPRDIVILTKSNSPSAVEPQILENKINDLNLTTNVFAAESISAAADLGMNKITENSILIIAGSLYTIGEITQFI